MNAATYSWNVDADGDTSLSSNWLGGVSPNGIGFAGDTINLINALTAPRTVTIDSVVTAGTLNIGDSTTTNAFNLASTATGILIMDASAGSAIINKALGANANDIISTNILFKDTLAITNASTFGSLTFSGGLRSLASDITFNGAGDITVSTAAIITAGGLTKNGTGTTTLSVASTYAGATTINDGTLAFSLGAALPARSAVTVAAGATLDFLNTATSIGSLSGAGTVTDSTASAARVLTIGRDDTSTTFNGQFLGPATKSRLAITKIGVGTLTLAPLSGSSSTAAGDFTGATIINGGAIKLDFSQGTFSGTSMLAATTLQLAGGNLEVKGRNSGSAILQTLGNFTLGASGGSIIMDPNGSTLGTTLKLGTITSTAAGGTLLINSPTDTSVQFNQNLSTATTVNGRIVFTDGVGAFNWAANGGVNTTTVGLGTYLDVAGTTMAATNTSNSRIDSATASEVTTVASGGSTTNSLKINSGAAGQSLSLGGNNLTLTNGGLLFTGANDYSITSSTGVLKSNTATNSDLVIHNYGAGTLTIGAIIGNGIGASTLTTAGTGTTVLTGANTFTGGVFVNGGILGFSDVANGAGGLGAGIASVVRIGDGGTLKYTGGTGTIAAATSAGSHSFVLNGGNATIEVTNAATSLSISGVISGGGGLTKIGDGTLILNGTNTYTGATIINAGILKNNGATRIPDSSPLVIGAAGTYDMGVNDETVGSLAGSGTVNNITTAKTLTVGGNNTSTNFSGALTGAIGNVFNKTGSGVLTIALASTTQWTGSSNVSQGVIQLGNNNGMPSTGTWTIANSASGPAGIDLNGFNWTTSGSSGITFYGTTSNSSSQGSINIGTGTLTLAGTGSVTVNLNGNPQQATIDATGIGGIVMTAQRTFDIRDSTAVPANRAELLINSNISGTGGGIVKTGSGNLRIVGGTNTTTGTNRFDSGITWLDYSIDNTAKLGSGALDMRGGTLVIEGNASFDTVESVASLTLASGGASTISVNAYGGQDASLSLGNITRAAGAGTIRFELPTGIQTTTNGIITNATNNAVTGLLGTGAGYATVTDDTGTWFAKNSTNAAGGNIVKADTVAQDNIALWNSTDNVTGSSGYTGTLGYVATVNSIRFNAPGVTSTVTLPDGGVLNIVSGGVLQTSNATGGSSVVTGGTLRSSAGDELIFTADSDQVFNVASQLTGTTSLTKAGDGSLRLSGNSNYATDSTGNVKLFAGTLRVDGGYAIGDNATLTIGATHSSIFELLASETIGTLASGGTTQTLGSSVDTLQTGIALNAHTLTFNQGTPGTYSGFFSGTGTLIKSGSATWTYNASGGTGNFTGTFRVNEGLALLNSNVNQFPSITDVIISGSTSSLRLDNDQTTAVGSRINDAANVLLINTAGTTTNALGLYMRRTAGTSTGTETMGQLILNAGHNTIATDATGASRIATISFTAGTPLVRNNLSTLFVVGRGIGDTAVTQRGNITFGSDPGGSVGGGGAAGTTTISIYPYVVGESTTGAPDGSVNFGNSFVRFGGTGAVGFKPLTTAEYVNDSAAPATGTNNVRYTATNAITTPATINSLVLDSGTAIDLTGSASSMEITSGAILAAGAGAHSVASITGFTTAGSNPYYVYVTNPSGSLTLATPLTSANALVKSGAGALILDSASNAFTDLYFNQGVVQADALNKLGSGDFNFFGGTLKFGAAFDPSSKTITFGTGGGTFDTNSFNVAFANSIGNSGAGGLTKLGAGSLALASGAAYAGDTSVQNGSLIVNSGSSMPSTGGLTLGSGADSGIVQLGDSGAGTAAWTVTSLATSGTGTTNAIVGGGADGSVLTVNQNTSTTYGGSLGGIGLNENNLSLTKSGIGSLTLSGATLTYTGATTLNGGTLNITGSPGAALATSGVTLARGSTFNLVNTAGQAINVGSGTLSLGASGTGTTVLGLELGSTSSFDRIITSGAAAASGNVLFNLTGLSGFGAGNYDLLTAASGLDGATYSVGNLTGTLSGYALSLTTDPTFVRIGAVALTGDIYWQGGIDASWMGNSGLNTNFTTDVAGTTNANGLPGTANTVIFSTTNNLQGPDLSTRLEADFAINDLKFNSNPSGVTAVSIASGTLTTNSLTITPSSSADGIVVADNAGAVTISAPLVLGADQTWDVVGTGANGSSLTISGAITGAANLTKIGAGTVTLSNASSAYGGTTTVSDGVLQAGIANGFNNTSAHIIGSSGILRLNNNSSTIGSLAGSGTVENGGAAAKTLTVGDANSTTFSGVLQNGGAGTLGLTKVGNGVLTLSGSSSTLTGAVTVNGGILKTTGAFSNGVGAAGTTTIASAASTSGMLYVPSGSYETTTITLGNNATAAGSLVINGGAVSTTTGTASLGVTMGAGYGGVFLQSGSLTTNRFELNSTGASSVGVIRVDGGTLTSSEFMIFRELKFEFTVTGGNVVHTPAANNIALGYSNSGTGTMTVTGGTVDNTGRNITIRESSSGTPNVSINLNGGTVITNQISKNNAAGTGVLNFNGGTLTPGSNGGTLVITGSGLVSYVNGAFGSFTGGALIDTAGNNTTISQALLSPAGDGVSGLSFTAGSGYIGAPIVEITGGGGSGATGYAVVDLDPNSGTFGQLTGVVLTNPGVGYTSTPTVTLYGGGGTGATVTATGTTANSSGGLTKNGTGILTLSGANTYTGGTTINAGSVALGANNVLADTGNVTIIGGTLDVNTRTDSVATVSLQSGGSITGTTGVLTSSADYDLQSGTVNFTGAGGLAGSGNVTKTTGGTVTLLDNGFNTTFAKVVNINGGTLEFSSSSQLGNGSATNTLGIDGGTLSLISPTTVDLGATRDLTIGSSGATLDTSFALGLLQLTGGITTSTAAPLTKTGPGTVTVTGTTDLNGGAVTVSGGTLNAGFSASGISGVTVAGGATLNLYDNAAVTAAITTLSLANGSTLGFDLDAPGTNDVLALTGSPTVAGTISVNLTNLGGLAAGTYDLITSTGGGLNGASYILGIAPSGLNYTFDPTVSANSILRLTASNLSLRYWTGDQDGSWSTNNAADTNWATDAAGTTDLGALPVSTDALVFSATNGNSGSGTITTTLDGNFTVDSLQFIDAPTTPATTAVIINQGTSGTLALAPVSANNGIAVGNSGGAVTIGAPLTVGANQTWEVIGTGANGSSLTITGDVLFSNAVLKTGAGTLTLGGAGTNTGAGGLTIDGGTFNIGKATAPGTGTLTTGPGITIDNTSGGALTLTNNNTLVWNGSFGFTGTDSLNLGTGAVTLGNNVVLAAYANSLTVGGAIDDGASTFDLTKAGAGILVLNGANSYDGLTSLLQGTLTLAGNNAGAAGGVTMAASTFLNLANAGALGTGTFTIDGGTLNNTFGSALTLSTNNVQTWNGNFTFTGTNSLNLGSGAVTLGASTDVTVTANTLTAGAVGDGASSFGITKNGTGTLVLGGVSTYDGATTIGNGTLRFTSGTQVLSSATNALVFGSSAGSTSLGALDLGTASATFGGATTVQTNSATANTITIGSGQTLRLNGAVTVGYNSGANTTTKLTASGLGTLTIGAVGAPTNANVQIGAGVTANFSNAATLDLSGLSTFYANLGTGTFRVGDPTSGGTAVGGSTVILAPTSTIIATTITSDSVANPNVVQAIKLGSTTNVFNANTITIGGSSNRANGTLDFISGTGTLEVRNLAGTGRAAFNVANGSATTTASPVGTVNLTGHSADLLLSTLTVGGRSAGTSGSATGTFSFDTGSLDATTVVVATRSGSTQTTSDIRGTLNLMKDGGSGAVTITTLNMGINSASTASTNGQSIATLFIGGTGTVGITTLTMASNSIGGGATNQTDAPVTSIVNISGSTTTINTLNMNTNSSANTGTGNASLSTLNISGGILNIGTGSGTPLNMANASNAAATATSTITITGTGTLNMNGNLAYTAGVGTENTTLTLNGGTLDMGGFNIGTLATPVGSGTGSLNFWSGTLMNVNQINGGADLVKAAGGTLILEGANGYTGATIVSAGTLQVGTGGTTGSINNTSGMDLTSVTATLRISRSDSLTIAQAITGAGKLEVANTPTGTTVLGTGAADTTANTYTGLTTVSGGLLLLDKADGTNAISSDAGLGGNDKVDDLVISGGSVKLNRSNQIADNASVLITSGTFDINGKSETIYNLTNSGGTVTTGRGSSFTVIDPTWSGGITDVYGSDSYGSLIISGGANTVHGDEGSGFGSASLTVGAGGLEFTGTLSPALNLSSDDVAPGILVLNGDVSFTGGAGTASITNSKALADDGFGGSTPVLPDPTYGSNSGQIDLGAATRTFTVSDGTAAIDMTLGGTLIGSAGVTKAGAGNLEFAAANVYSGVTTVNAGALTVSNATGLGTGGNVVGDGAKVNSGGVLHLNSAAVLSEHLTLNGTGSVRSNGTSSWGGTIMVSNSEFDVVSGTLSVTGTVTGTGGITKLGAGDLELAGAPVPVNDFSGPVIVNAGSLTLNRAADPSPSPGGTTIPNSSSAIAVNGGSLIWMNNHQVGNDVPVELAGGSLDLNGFTESMGALTLTSSSVIDLGPGGDVVFNGFGAWNPLATLAIWNYDGALFTGTGATGSFFIAGLGDAELAQIQFFSGSGIGALGSGAAYAGGAIVPVPEPSAVLSLAFLLGLIGWRERGLVMRRRRTGVKLGLA